MSTALSNLSAYDAGRIPDVTGRRFGLVVAEWNSALTSVLAQGACDTLLAHGVRPEHIHLTHVPGSFELTLGAQRLAQRPTIRR